VNKFIATPISLGQRVSPISIDTVLEPLMCGPQLYRKLDIFFTISLAINIAHYRIT